MSTKKKVSIIGAGPSGLFSSYLLLKHGFTVDLYDSNPGIGRKFLIAGKGGLNITHSEGLDDFSTRYGKDETFFRSLLEDFSNEDLIKWCQEVGVETFIGSSGRVFPKKLNAGAFLNKWKKILNSFEEFSFYPNHSLKKISKEKELIFDKSNNEIKVHAEIVILAMGGASWKSTGSDGKWSKILSEVNFKLLPFQPMNCGFHVDWSEIFLKKSEGQPIKNISIRLNRNSVKGELMITSYGLEGGAIYAISNNIRDEILRNKICEIRIDLKPNLSKEKIREHLEKVRSKDSMKNTLRKTLKLSPSSYQLLIESSDREKIHEHEYLIDRIKSLPIIFKEIRPIDEAISTGGGVCFSSLNKSLESHENSDFYCVGEMLDFETITGGYLLQGCFSTSYRAVKSILSKKTPD